MILGCFSGKSKIKHEKRKHSDLSADKPDSCGHRHFAKNELRLNRAQKSFLFVPCLFLAQERRNPKNISNTRNTVDETKISTAINHQLFRKHWASKKLHRLRSRRQKPFLDLCRRHNLTQKCHYIAVDVMKRNRESEWR